LFVTTIVYVTFCPGDVVAGPLFVMPRSACAPTFVVAVALLSAPFGSVVVEATVAVLVTLPLKLGDVLYVAVIVAVWPGVIVPRPHGKLLVHAPPFDTHVRFAG
jgi:hypothetical protein